MSKIPAETDVVVIGSGVSGLAAALTAAEAGAKVIVFEKLRSLGGTSNFFVGTFAVESRRQKERYITYDRDAAFKEIIEYGHWRNNPRLVRAIVNESASTLAWLEEQGVEVSEVTINMANAPRTYHLIKGKGEAVVKVLATRAREKGVEIIIGTPVKQVLKEGDRITGVIVEGEEDDAQVAAKAVVIASGGYLNNKEWVKKYTGFEVDKNLQPIGNVDKMGDGIRMAWEVGAAEESIDIVELFRMGPQRKEVGTGGRVSIAVMQPDLWVNQAGERFCDESTTHYDTSQGNANARHKEGYTYNIFDDTIKQRIMEVGIDKGISPDTLPGMTFPDFDKDLQAALANDTTEVFEANSIEELAGKMGIDPAVLKATLDEYNSFCEKGHDDLFAKNPGYLRPLRGPKYYAVKAHTICLGTMGGIKINERTEVVDKNDKVISGLYAVGYDAGGMYGQDYPMKVASGLSSAFASNSGRIAGKNASAFIK
ncbi:FAD-dependent oxidoreductase [Chloroflexota bacterium]